MESLDKLLMVAARKPYKLGEHDCFTFASKDLWQFFTGSDICPFYISGYKSHKQAVKMLVKDVPNLSRMWIKICKSYGATITSIPPKAPCIFIQKDFSVFGLSRNKRLITLHPERGLLTTELPKGYFLCWI